jgi:uncharacterized protein (TIRG00374 family)
MPIVLTPRLLRRGLELFAVISILGIVLTLVIFGGNVGEFLDRLLHLHWGWALGALALAASDWVGGGLRLWMAARHLQPGVPFRGMVVAGGLNSWAAYLTPSQTGGGPFMVWVMKRYGVPYAHGTICAFVTFVATVAFFGVAGPLALFLGAGRSLEQHGIPVIGLSFLDLFRASMGMFVLIGIAMIGVIAFPGTIRRLIHALAVRLGHWKPALETRIDRLRGGVDQMHDALVKFFGTGRGWLALVGIVIATGFAFANKLLAGYFVLRALGRPAHFVDVLLVQTLVFFLLYFAPTPGGSGIAELLSAALMSIYVPRDLLATYTTLWRLSTSYLTVGVGSLIFWQWLRRGLIGREDAVGESLTRPEQSP